MWVATSLEPLFRGTGGNVNAHALLTSYWGFGGGIHVNRSHLDDRALRGGPALAGEDSVRVNVHGNTDGRERVRANLFATLWLQPATDSREVATNLALSVQARSNLDLGVGTSLSLHIDDNQYVDAPVDAMGDPHYVLARIRQVVGALTLRVDYTFSPKLSLQLYAQPFIAAGHYSDYKEVVAPRAADYADRAHTFGPAEIHDGGGTYEIDRDGDGSSDFAFGLGDFNFREIRSNAVMRWEYLPGSALFLIWSHERASDSPYGRFRLGSDLADLARAPGEHLVLVKLNYWIGL